MAGSFDNFTIRKNVLAAQNVAAALHCRGRAVGGCCDVALRRSCELVHQPHVKQRVCRHPGRHFSIFRGTCRCSACCAVVGRVCRLATCGRRRAQEDAAMVHEHFQEQHRAHRPPAACCGRVEQPDAAETRMVRGCSCRGGTAADALFAVSVFLSCTRLP
jgi:hypothetical protein